MPTISTPPAARSRFLVVGAGGIGGIVAAHLLEQGFDATALTTNPLIADAINAHGFRVRGESSPGTIRGVAVTDVPAGRFDFILLATQPTDVENAAQSTLGVLAENGRMVCFQNGLCEDRVGAIVGPGRVIGAVVAWGASMLEPGIYDRTSAGGFQIGYVDGSEDERLFELGRALECIGPTVVTKNLSGARWSKLAINAAISAIGTVGGDRLGVLMRHRYVRRLALEIMTEVVQIANASGVKLEKVSGTLDLDWIALTDDERTSLGSAALLAKHALLLAVGARYRRLRSSMLAAIERGRPPAVQFLNGEVASRGLQLGVPTPINAAIRDQVLAIAAGKSKSSHTELRAFFERTRALLDRSGSIPAAPPVPSMAPPEVALSVAPRPAQASADLVLPIEQDPLPYESQESAESQESQESAESQESSTDPKTSPERVASVAEPESQPLSGSPAGDANS